MSCFSPKKMENGDYEQRINIKFCFKLEKTPNETHAMLVKVYGDAAVTRKTVYKWFERFRNGYDSVEDEKRSGRPSTSRTEQNVSKVNEMIYSNERATIREIASDLNISFGSVQKILAKDLNMRTKVPAAKPAPVTKRGRKKPKSTEAEDHETTEDSNDGKKWVPAKKQRDPSPDRQSNSAQRSTFR